MHNPVVLILLIALTVLCSSGAQFSQKLAANAVAESAGLKATRYFLVSLILLAAGLIFWLLLLSRVDVGIAYPILSLNFVVVLVIAKVAFNEHVPKQRWFGTLVILCGVTLLLSSGLE